MRLFIVRHGHALDQNADPKRPLSTKGRQEAEKTARVLAKCNIKSDFIMHSIKSRAAQTAEIISETLSIPSRESGLLSPSADPVAITGELDSSSEDHVIVGHLPNLEILATYLVGGESVAGSILNMEPAACACLCGSGRNWKLLFLTQPSIID